MILPHNVHLTCSRNLSIIKHRFPFFERKLKFIYDSKCALDIQLQIIYTFFCVILPEQENYSRLQSFSILLFHHFYYLCH
jgi:hypothetical protein